MTELSPEPPAPDEDPLLRELEQRLRSKDPPLQVLADLLTGRTDRRLGLFQRLGDTVLGYRLSRILGAGGMGVTYAGSANCGTVVAVKLVAEVVGALRDRFDQECRILQSLQHPAIVRYREHAVLDDDCGVLVMDLISGCDLELLFTRVLSNNPPADGAAALLLHEVRERGKDVLQSPRYRRRVLRMMAVIAEGLHYAHQHGIVHRDIKPANILVTDQLDPIVIDFGLARDLRQKVSFTRSGAAMGTLAYIAPEQLGRDPGAVDARTDVYGLGLILFRAFTGADLRQEVADILQHSQRPFLLNARNSQMLPAPLQAILYRCLEYRLHHRYSDAAALAADLRAAASDGKLTAKRPPFYALLARDQRKVLAMTTITLLMIALIVWPMWPRGRDVVIQTTSPDVLISIDGTSVKPFAVVWLPYGKHQLAINSDSPIKRSIPLEVVPGIGPQFTPLRTRTAGILIRAAATGEELAQIQFQTGHNLIAGIADSPTDERFINGVPQLDRTMIMPRMPAGRYELTAKDRLGRTESINIDVVPGDNVDVLLLPREMHEFNGSFRRTWASTLSPLPPDVTISGTASSWAEPNPQSDTFGTGARAVRCCFASSSASNPCDVRLRIDFPEPMQSIALFARGMCKLGAKLSVVVTGDQLPETEWPKSRGQTLDPHFEVQCQKGCRFLEVRASLIDIVDSQGEPYARMFDGTFCGGHWFTDPPCFAVVADPKINVTRSVALQRAEITAPARLPAPVLFLPDNNRKAANYFQSCFVRGPGGRVDLLLTGETVTDRSQAIARFRWPDGTRLESYGVPAFGFARESDRLELLRISELPDENEDGFYEFAIRDLASERNRGTRSTIMTGAVTIHDGRTGRELRSISHQVSPTPAGDDHFGDTAVLAGDWDGDDRPELAISAMGFMAFGFDHCGRVEVRSTIAPDRPSAFSKVGSGANVYLKVLAASRPQHGPATLALVEDIPHRANENDFLFMAVSLVSPDRALTPAILTCRGKPGIAFLHGNDNEPLRVAVACSMSYFQGYVLLERDMDIWREVLRVPSSTDNPDFSWHEMLAIPDQDGRGREDFALLRVDSQGSPDLALIAGEDLSVISIGVPPANVHHLKNLTLAPSSAQSGTELMVTATMQPTKKLGSNQTEALFRFALPVSFAPARK